MTVLPVGAIPRELLERLSQDPRVKAAARAAQVDIKGVNDVRALLSNVPAAPRSGVSPSLFQTCHSRKPADMVRAYQQVATYE